MFCLPASGAREEEERKRRERGRENQSLFPLPAASLLHVDFSSRTFPTEPQRFAVPGPGPSPAVPSKEER